MKRHIIALACISMLGLAAPAHAGWRSAQWGMTETQIKKLYPDVEPPEKSTTIGDTIIAMKDVTFAGIKWYSVYFIMSDAGRLTRVQLMSHDNRFPYIKGQLASQFGTPVLNEPNKARFSDAKHHNSVEIMQGDLFSIFLTYSQPSERF